jgi:hypothetical protein
MKCTAAAAFSKQQASKKASEQASMQASRQAASKQQQLLLHLYNHLVVVKPSPLDRFRPNLSRCLLQGIPRFHPVFIS